jgi:hypothetical protein
VIKLLMRQNLILKKSLWAILLLIAAVGSPWGQVHCSEEPPVLDMQIIKEHLRDHLTMLTRTIGERSVRKPENIERSAAYIQAQFEKYGLAVERQTYRYKTIPVSNVVARMKLSERPAAHYVVGAHYDSVSGTVGADDNASAVAVMLETARALQAVAGGPEITFVAFALGRTARIWYEIHGQPGFRDQGEAGRLSHRWHDLLGDGGLYVQRTGLPALPVPASVFWIPQRWHLHRNCGQCEITGI